MRTHPSRDRAYRRRWWMLAVLSVSLVIIGLDNTILNVAIPTIQRELGASASELQWIVDAYVLVFAGLLLSMGALGDRYGRKRALQAGLLVFGVSSVGAAFAGTSGQLIAARAVMGVGGALIMPSTLSIIVDVFPRDEQGKAIGIWTGMAALGIAIGPALGGWLLEHFWWGSVFMINVPVVVVALAGGLALVPESRDPAGTSVDVPGAALSVVTLFSLVYAIIEAPARGWLDPLVVGAFAGSAVVGSAFLLWERRARHPMLDLVLFSNPRFSVGVLSITLAFFALFGTIFVNTQYLQFVHGYSALEAGLAITPVALGMLVGAANSHRLVGRFGTGKVVGFGMAVLSAALASYVFWTASTPYPVIGVTIVIMSFGIANAMAPATEAVMGAVPVAKAGVGSAMNDTTRQVGGAFGVAILGSVVNAVYDARMTAPPGAPPDIARLVNDSVGGAIAVAERLGGPEGAALAGLARAAFLDAMDAAMAVAAAVAFVGALVAWRFMPARGAAQEEATRVGAPVRRAVLGVPAEPDHGEEA